MKHLLLLTFIIISIVSCHGNKTKQDTLKESVQKFKDSLGTLEVESFIPETYSEVKTDTILSNGISISIKTYTDMNRFVTFKYQVDKTLTHIDKFRDWISVVTIKKDNVLIFDKTLDANFFLEQDKTMADSVTKAINNKVWINEALSMQKDEVFLMGGFIFPESKNVVYYDIIVDSKGKYRLKKLKRNY